MPNQPDELDTRVLVERLIKQHEAAVRHFIAGRSGRRVLRWTTVDDLYQQTVRRALNRADRFEYRGDALFLQWILTIARRVIARPSDAPRQLGPTLRLKCPASSGPGLTYEDLPPSGRTPSSVASAAERRGLLRSAIAKLPPNQRRALTLVRIEQMPFDDVAAEMGRTTHALGELIRRAQQSLLKKLGVRDASDLF
ncbi:MAG: RNA polymerase sigma factor [Phycisphaerae bacterium]